MGGLCLLRPCQGMVLGASFYSKKDARRKAWHPFSDRGHVSLRPGHILASTGGMNVQNGNGKLKIYTVINPDGEAPPSAPRRIRLPNVFHRKPKAEDAKPVVEQAKHPVASAKATRQRHINLPKAKGKLSATEKLMRNSAVACALLLSILALQNINNPWTQNATAKIRQALTMRIDLDESLGRLNFVRGLVPESAQVFWNMGGKQLQLPVSGTISHEYADVQPWVEFVCSPQAPVTAADEGTVAAVGQGAQGDWTLLIDHESGTQTVYAYLSQVLVKVGQQVARGDQLGITRDEEGSRLYFELRKDGQPQNPEQMS